MRWHSNSWTKTYSSSMVSTFARRSITLRNSHSRFDRARYDVARDHPDGERRGSEKSRAAISLFFTYSLAFLADIPLTDRHLDNATGPSWDNDPSSSLCLHSCSKPSRSSLTSQTRSGSSSGSPLCCWSPCSFSLCSDCLSCLCLARSGASGG
jgi:hypothetical protein